MKNLLLLVGAYLVYQHFKHGSVSGGGNGTGMQTCIASDGSTFMWLSSEACPYADHGSSTVPYVYDNDGNLVPVVL